MEKFAKKSSTRSLRKILSVILAVSMILTANASLFAADSWPPIGEKSRNNAQPAFFGYRVADIVNWSAEVDPYSEFLTAKIPLQNRIDSFQATQANPELKSEAEVMLMQGEYGNSFFDSMIYNNSFSEHVLNFWQYADYFSPWHGAATSSTPQSIYDPATSDWQARGFEFGIVNIPNPAYTNAAHKNGVMSIACVYFDPAFRPEQTCKDLFLVRESTGEYTAAKKLVELAEYYGFDGYFMNQEEGGNVNEFKELMSYLTQHGLWTQWYDTNSSFNSSKAAWLEDDVYGKIHDSVFVNYGWPGSADSCVNFATTNGYDQFKQVFYGVECNQGKLNNSHSSMSKIDDLFEEGTNNPRGSVALFTPSDYYQRSLDDDVKIKGLDMPVMQTDEYQWMVAERERMFFSGAQEDPTNTNTTAARSDVGISNVTWRGVADFIPSRSVIGGSVFYTNFNTGHGMQFFNEGEVSFDDQWANINIQDILPSWQWWIDSEGSSKLAADFDYGTKEIRNDTKANKTTLPYTQIGAYKGGSSLVLYGDVDAKNTMHLYKTDLAVNSASTAEVTFKKTSSGNAGLKLGVITKEDPTNVVEIDVSNSAEAGEWTTETLSLGSLAGKHIAAICLVVDGSEKDFQINVGGLRILDGKNHTPSAPSNFRIDRAYDSKEMILKWDLADYSEVKQYNVYAVKDGKEVYLGGVYDDIYYIKDLAKVIAQEGLTTIDSVDVDPADITLEKGEGADFTAIVNGSTEKGGAITIRVKAVGADGSESEPASEKYNYDEKVSNVVVDESLTESGLLTHATNPGQLDVSWNAPLTGDFDSYKFTVTLLNVSSEKQPQKVFTSTADKDATSAVVPLPVAEGCDYDLAISTVKDGVEGEPIYYRGRSNDSYAEPYTIDKMLFSGNSVRMVIPDAIDWQYLTVYADGKQIKEFKRGAGPRFQGDMKITVPDGTNRLAVTLRDYSGNTSEEVSVPIVGIVIDPETATLTAGETQQFTVAVTNADDPSVTWSVSGATSPDTKVDADGLLTLGKDETSTLIKVKAALNENPNVSKEITVGVKLLYAVAPASGDVYRGESLQLNVTDGTDLLDPTEYTWSIDSYPSMYDERSVIDENGVLTIGPEETQKSVRITATNKANSLMKLAGSYSIKPALEIKSEQSFVYAGEQATLTATYKGEALDNADVTWTVEGANDEATTIDENGVLTASADETANSVVVRVVKNDDANAVATLTLKVKINLAEKCPSVGSTILGYAPSDDYYLDPIEYIDGDEDTGNFTYYAGSGWVAIDLGKECAINRWKLVSPKGYVMQDFAVEVLKDSNATAEQLADEAYLADDANWTEIDAVTENTDPAYSKAIDVTGRYFRLRVDYGFDYYGWYDCWGAQEFELFGKAVEGEGTVSLNSYATEARATAVMAPITREVEGIPQEVTWTVEGATSADTTIDENGHLTVGLDETAETLTVRATSVADPEVSGTATVHVIESTAFAITIGDVENGTVKADKVVAKEGETVTVTATPDEGYELVNIKVNGKVITGDSFEMPAEDVVITATFVKLPVDDLGVTVTPPKADVEQGASQQFEAALTDGATGEVKSAMDNATVVGSVNVNNPNAFIDGVLGNDTYANNRNSTASVTFDLGEVKEITQWELYTRLNDNSAPFGAKSVTLEYLDEETGEFVLVDELTDICPEGDNGTPLPTLSVLDKPVSAKEFRLTVTEWYLQSNGQPDWPGMDEIILYTGSASSEPDDGETEFVWTVDGATSADTTIDENGLLTVGADETAETLEVKATVKDNETKFGTATVTVIKKEFSIIVDDAIVNGTVTADKDVAKEGETVTLTITPDEGYRVLSVTVNGDAITGNTFKMPAEDVTVSATFELIPADKYQITIDETENGTVTADKTEAEEGETVTLTVKPDAGYEVDSITVNGEVITGNTFEMPAEDVTVTVTFKESKSDDLYNVTVKVTGKGTATVDKATAAEGEKVTVTATPDAGYKFSYIKVNGKKLNGTTEFTMPAGDATVVVVFTKISTGGGSGSTTPSQPTPDYEIEVIYPEVVTPEAPGTTNPPTGDSFGGLALMLALAGGAMVVLKKRHEEEN